MSSPYLGRIELTQQPEKVFYKDEGGQKTYYLFVFFVVRAVRTSDLKEYMDRAANGRRKIPVDATLVYDNEEPVEDQKILQLLGNSRSEMTEISDGTPEFDPNTFTGSIRYRINKVSMRKDNQGFRLRIHLRGLEHIIEPALTEATVVLSKRKRLRKANRIPEQDIRDKVEREARARNAEVEEQLARSMPTSTALIHEIGPGSVFSQVSEYPDLRTRQDDDFGNARRELMLKRHRAGSSGEGGDSIPDSSTRALLESLSARLDILEKNFKSLEGLMLGQSIPNASQNYAPPGIGEKDGGVSKLPSLSLMQIPSNVGGFSAMFNNNSLLQEGATQQQGEEVDSSPQGKGKRAVVSTAASKAKRQNQAK